MGTLLELTSENFDAEVVNAKGKVVVDFWAPWCGPCKMQTPILERLATDENINAKFVKLNTDDSPSVAEKMGIVSIPTLIYFNDGEEIERFVGVQPEEVLKAKLS